jgi:hypothetical protein
MTGWSEEEIRNRDLMSPCGLYCGVCGIYLATRDNNLKFKTAMGNLYGTPPEETECLGCMQPAPPKRLYGFCRLCTIRDCVTSKGFYSCHQCTDWPCPGVTGFGLATGRRVMLQAIPLWRDLAASLGDEQGSVEWARRVCERYHCPYCEHPLFRGAQRCRSCGRKIADELDGTL